MISKFTLGIDACNIRAGGGVTHLVELLNSAEPMKYGFDKVIIWGCTKTLAKIENKDWLEKIYHPFLDKALFFRIFWSAFLLKRELKVFEISLLFVPGGSSVINFRPMVTMNQNLLPFEWKELKRYGWSFSTLKNVMLRLIQSTTFKKAQGVIFLTHYAKVAVQKVTGKLASKYEVISHGINPMFDNSPTYKRYKKTFSNKDTFKILYVSGLEPYKNQWHVAEAVSILYKQGYPMHLDLVGPTGLGYIRLLKTMKRVDPCHRFIEFHGVIPYDQLKQMYFNADIGVFASTCETFGQILTESMSAGLPLACSNRSAMPEILEDSGIYFDPEKPAEIAESIRTLYHNQELRFLNAFKAYQKSKKYTWEKCAQDTFEFFKEHMKPK